ncbi:uncharacterized protein LOC125075380 [Vanessa atalanta]|uniref:uncharacterized protein LOC125075380 n=1 Tax=Vanessa atalanta TaxID=42275 RepID=UPI001FCDEF32|nr:uncharacterized protein LOC125075380 [Vanessa atalanta]
MKYEIIFLPFWVINCSHIQQNDSEVFITYAGHSDVERETVQRHNIDTEKAQTATENIVTEDIVFIPNDKPVIRNEDTIKIDDVINTRRVGDLMRDSAITEKPNQDILFITGKNHDNNNEDQKMTRKNADNESNGKINPTKRKSKLDCTNLDCNSTVRSICGGRKENSQWKFRLFLNECYFRKVNCGFQYAVNRYELVTMDKCENIGGHYPKAPYNYKPVSLYKPRQLPINETRRSFVSRRSMSVGIDGTHCGHACPISCTEDYEPQCAISSAGQRKVFLNHCKLDQNSCIQNVAWHRRPLSECVGGKKADMNQNRGFISWMQRVGIIDRNGRLVLS